MRIRLGKFLSLTFPQVSLLRDAVIYPIQHVESGPKLGWMGGGLYQSNGWRDPERPHQMRRTRQPTSADWGQLPTFERPAFYAGPMKMHFGHFVCESIGRLWALAELPADIPLVFLADRWSDSDIGATAQQFFQIFGITNEIVLVSKPTKFTQIWNATDLFRPFVGEGIHSKLRDWLQAGLPPSTMGMGADIYVSRNGLPARYGRVLNESFIEAGMAQAGYQIFRPEKHSLLQQIDAYRDADRIVASESSAMHLASMFAKPTVKVAIIRRRPVRIPSVDSMTIAFQSRDVSFVDAIERYWRAPETTGNSNYQGMAQLNMQHFWRDLQNKGFIADAGKAPLPSQAETEAEWQERAGNRTAMFQLKPGVRYS